jgi:hypothetical protein
VGKVIEREEKQVTSHKRIVTVVGNAVAVMKKGW